MRISDWSSDVCSSDLGLLVAPGERVLQGAEDGAVDVEGAVALARLQLRQAHGRDRRVAEHRRGQVGMVHGAGRAARSEESGVGKECVSTCGSRGSHCYSKKNNH